MSSCSATGAPRAAAQPPPTAAGQVQLATGAPADGTSSDAVNAPHHLLRHVLSPEQCTDALRHFGTTDAKTAARMVNRMSQRELRDTFEKVGDARRPPLPPPSRCPAAALSLGGSLMAACGAVALPMNASQQRSHVPRSRPSCATSSTPLPTALRPLHCPSSSCRSPPLLPPPQVYCVHTNSNNNTWLRRKLLEAVGASRRFYSAASKTGGRPKARKAEGGAGGDRKRVRRDRRPAGEAGAAAPCTPAATAAAAHAAAPVAHHAAVHAGPVLPAGSPRALSQRMRQRGGEPQAPHHFTHRVLLQQVHVSTPPFQYTQPPAAAEEEGEDGSCSGHSASDVHTYTQHRLAVQPSSLDSGGPASPFAAAAQRRTQHSLLAAHNAYMG